MQRRLSEGVAGLRREVAGARAEHGALRQQAAALADMVSVLAEGARSGINQVLQQQVPPQAEASCPGPLAAGAAQELTCGHLKRSSPTSAGAASAASLDPWIPSMPCSSKLKNLRCFKPYEHILDLYHS